MKKDKSLYEKITSYTKKMYPMHMPGHKRSGAMLGGRLPYHMDITEVPGFDNLQQPEGVLKDISDRAARLYGSKHTFLSVNGSTGAILASVFAATDFGDKVIMARNCHISVYHAVQMRRLKTAYIVPALDRETGVAGSISPKDVKIAVENNPDAKLLILTSPTYEGVVSNISEIVKIAHAYGILVLVDSAHGAHMNFGNLFGKCAVKSGADLVVMSLHKTLPALTQTALLHIASELANKDRVRDYINYFQTTSPSYILLSSIDECLRFLEKKGRKHFDKYVKNLTYFDKKVKSLKHLKVLCYGEDTPENHGDFYSFDKSKIVVSTKRLNITGMQLAESIRKKYKIEPEMSYSDYAIFMTSVCDSKKGLKRLASALLKIDKKVAESPDPFVGSEYGIPEKACEIYEAAGDGKKVTLEEAIGKISLEYVWAYPPGVAMIAPGEMVNRELCEKIRELSESGIEIKSSRFGRGGKIFVK